MYLKDKFKEALNIRPDYEYEYMNKNIKLTFAIFTLILRYTIDSPGTNSDAVRAPQMAVSKTSG